jgi:crotonobetainyl-CoA hydratase
MSSAAVYTERHDLTMVVTINRPEARNAIDRAVTYALGDALAEAEADPAVRVVVLTGAGDVSFCAGADLKALARGENLVPVEEPRRSWGFAGYVNHVISKPTIAAVNGAAVGGGTELVLASDLAVASDTAVFGLPEVSRGLIPGAGGTFRLARQLPAKLALEILLTGDTFGAATALEYHLVNRVVPGHRLMEETLALAARIADNAPLAVAASKRLALGIHDDVITSERDLWIRNDEERAFVRSSEDAKEGPRAFTEKRLPVWVGR